MEGTGNREEMVEMEEGRAAGPRWAEVQQEVSEREKKQKERRNFNTHTLILSYSMHDRPTHK